MLADGPDGKRSPPTLSVRWLLAANFILHFTRRMQPKRPTWDAAKPGLCDPERSSRRRAPTGRSVLCSSLASDVDEFNDDQLRRFKELTREDLAEALSAAVAEKKSD